MAIDETLRPDETPAQYVARMSTTKCSAAQARFAHWLQDAPGDRVLLAADTIVVAAGVVLGKPTSDEAAAAMLRALSK